MLNGFKPRVDLYSYRARSLTDYKSALIRRLGAPSKCYLRREGTVRAADTANALSPARITMILFSGADSSFSAVS